MMYPRLVLARSFLRDDGVIFVSIDDNEVADFRLLMNEVFGEENFLGQICIMVNPKGRVLGEHFARSHEYLVVYAKAALQQQLGIAKSVAQIENEYGEEDDGGKYRLLELRNTHRQFGRFNRKNLWYPLYIDTHGGRVSVDPAEGLIEVYPRWSDGFEGCWTWERARAAREAELLVGKRVNGEWKVFRKAYAVDSEGNVATKKLKTTWSDSIFYTERGQREFDELIPGRVFQSPKPISLVKLAVQLASSGDDIVLDFFAGACTTAQAVLEMNREDGDERRFIMVQLPEPTGNPQYSTIADIGKERIRRAIA